MSIELGKFNQLEVVKEVDFGLYLDGGDEGEILLPTRYVPEDCKVGDMLNVFLYGYARNTDCHDTDSVGAGRAVRLSRSLLGEPVRGIPQLGIDERLICTFQ